MPNTSRLLVASGHDLIREGLKAILRDHASFVVVGETSNAPDTLRQGRLRRPDLVILDAPLLDSSEECLIDLLQTVCPGSRVLMLLAEESQRESIRVREAGTVWYVRRSAGRGEILGAVHEVLDGRAHPASANGFTRTQSSDTARKFEELSDREEQVLRLIALGLSNKQIAARLTVSVKTVETYKSRSMKKLGLQSRVDIIRYAVQSGWLVEDAVPR